jgi:hypothetical protein
MSAYTHEHPRNRAGWRTSWRTALNHVVVSPSPLSAQTAGEFEHLARRDYTRATGPTPPAHDFVPAIGLQTAYSQMVPGWSPARRGVPRLLRYTCATGHLGADLVGAQSVTVRAVTPDHSERLQYHVLPTDDPLRALNILREAAGLPPLSDERDDEGG